MVELTPSPVSVMFFSNAAYLSTKMMEALCCFETSVPNDMASVTKDSPLHSHHCEDLVSNRIIIYKQDGKFACKPNTETCSCDHCCSGKAISITHYEFVFAALGIQNAMLMRRIILSSVVCLAVPYFSTLSHKRHDVLKKLIEGKMCVVIFSVTFVSSISHFKNRAKCYHKGR